MALFEKANTPTIMTYSKNKSDIEMHIQNGHLDLIKEIIESDYFNATQTVNIAKPDWEIIWLAIKCGQLKILKYFCEEAHKFGQPMVDFTHWQLIAAAQKASPEVNYYFDLLSSLTDDQIMELSKIKRAHREPRRL